MEAKKIFRDQNNEKNTDIVFEHVQGKDHLVKAISFEQGKKNEVVVTVLSEEQFYSLIPKEQKEEMCLSDR